MTNKEVARLLRQIAAVFEIKGAQRFRQIAYEKAAENIEHLSKDLTTLWQQNKLQTVPGIGKHLSSHLSQLFSTGKVKHFDTLTKDMPKGMFELMDVPGIGPKNAFKLASEFKLNNPKTAIKKLKQAAKKGKIQNIQNFGKISQKAILTGIKEKQSRNSRIMLNQASLTADQLIDYLTKLPAIKKINTLGSLRRRRETTGDIDIAVSTNKPKQVLDHFVLFPEKKRILAQGINTARILLQNDIQVDIKTQTPDKYGALLQHFTGSKAHNVALRELAINKSLSLSEYGIKNKQAKTKAFADEKKFYEFLGLDWIPPELRENKGEIEAARAYNLPQLIKPSDIKGDLHTHANYKWISSHDTGVDSMQAMINKAIDLKYHYLGLGDHNPSLSSYSNSKLISLIKAKKAQIDKLKDSHENNNTKRPIKILNCLEIDIRSNGSLALPDKALDLLDYAVVSVHSSMRQSKEEMTKRVLSAFSHPKALILGHPTGRLINKRTPFQLNWEKIFDFAQKNKKVIEINAHPMRLDLPDILVRQAIKYKVMLVINTDAHSTSQLDLMKFGVDVARRGWAEKKNIINTLSFAKLSAIINTL